MDGAATTTFRVGFVIAGAQKGGTTALASFLAEHPSICMAPDKEVHLFDDPDLDGADFGGEAIAERYRRAFPNYDGEPCVGEATPIYLYLPGVAARVRAYNPGMKWIFLLREPSERAVSHYLHERRLQFEWMPFVAAIAREEARLKTAAPSGVVPWDSPLRHHSYVDRGRYAAQVRRVFDLFPREQALLLRSEELATRHDETLARVFDFLGVEAPGKPPEARRVHERSGWCFAPRFVRRRIARGCLSSTEELERLLDWDLAAWKEVARR